jgi:hypothetical protein
MPASAHSLTRQPQVVLWACRYGGILLGPARFTFINNAARQLLDTHGYIARKEVSGKGSGKGKKA